MGDKGKQRGRGGQKSQKRGDMMTSIIDGPLASVIILRIGILLKTSLCTCFLHHLLRECVRGVAGVA